MVENCAERVVLSFPRALINYTTNLEHFWSLTIPPRVYLVRSYYLSSAVLIAILYRKILSGLPLSLRRTRWLKAQPSGQGFGRARPHPYCTVDSVSGGHGK